MQQFDSEAKDQSIDSEAEKQIKEFVEKLEQKITNAPNEQKKISFLLTGRTGVGKSSTINFLMGKKVAPVGDFEPTTTKVESYKPETYKSNISGVEIIIHDTPGLCDDLEDAGNDYKYLELMRSQVDKVNSMWFVSRLDDKRVASDEKRGIKLISEYFTPEIWKQAIIIFTFADNVSPEKYPDTLQKRSDLIRKEISKYADIQIANNIPSVAVDNENMSSRDGQKRLGDLFTQVYLRLSVEDALPFLMSTVHRIQQPKKEPAVIYKYIHRDTSPTKPVNSETPVETEPDDTSDNPYDVPIELTGVNVKRVTERNEQVIDYVARGAAIGAATGASVAGLPGAVIGAGVGALVGFFFGSK